MSDIARALVNGTAFIAVFLNWKISHISRINKEYS